MDERLARTISNLGNWDDLGKLEANVRSKKRFDEEVAAAISTRSAELGRKLVHEKTGLEMEDLSPAEEKIVRAVSEYVGIMRQQGKYPGRTFDQLRSRGLLGAAESAVCRARPTQGFQNLADADLEDLSYEQIVIDHADEFSARAVWFSRKTLGLHNTSNTPPAETESETQTRTVALVNWLKNQAKGNGGLIPLFSNTDTAAVLGMQDMARYGRVLGNVQSRIDYACYVCGLPPLGLAAAEPFEKAWAQQKSNWAYPLSEMKATAQSRQWSPEEFDRVLQETKKLPGQAHILWKDALSVDEAKVKDWAFSFVNSGLEFQIKDEIQSKRNPSWSRDELILALELYLHHRASPPDKDSLEVAELSEFLNRMGQALGLIEVETYRNENGVYMKMMNFRRFDTEYTKDGKVGLTRGNKDEEVVWREFSNDTDRLANVAAAIRSAVESHGDDRELEGMDEPEIQEAEEGRVLTRLHRIRERSRKLVEGKKKAVLKLNGCLSCEACGFDFSKKYGSAGEGLIDVHHTKPVHTLTHGDKTRLEDLVLLCSNCHRVVHSSHRWLTVEEVQRFISR